MSTNQTNSANIEYLQCYKMLSTSNNKYTNIVFETSLFKQQDHLETVTELDLDVNKFLSEILFISADTREFIGDYALDSLQRVHTLVALQEVIQNLVINHYFNNLFIVGKQLRIKY